MGGSRRRWLQPAELEVTAEHVRCRYRVITAQPVYFIIPACVQATLHFRSRIQRRLAAVGRAAGRRPPLGPPVGASSSLTCVSAELLKNVNQNIPQFGCLKLLKPVGRVA